MYLLLKVMQTELVEDRRVCDDRQHVYVELETSSKIRHYLPNNLRSYIGYTRQFRVFVTSKNVKLVELRDVGEILTWTAGGGKSFRYRARILHFYTLLFRGDLSFQRESWKV